MTQVLRLRRISSPAQIGASMPQASIHHDGWPDHEVSTGAGIFAADEPPDHSGTGQCPRSRPAVHDVLRRIEHAAGDRGSSRSAFGTPPDPYLAAAVSLAAFGASRLRRR